MFRNKYSYQTHPFALSSPYGLNYPVTNLTLILYLKNYNLIVARKCIHMPIVIFKTSWKALETARNISKRAQLRKAVRPHISEFALQGVRRLIEDVLWQ